MRIGRNRITTEVVEMGTVRITYLTNQTGRPEVHGVSREQFGRLRNVVQAYHQLTDLHGQRETHPNEYVRSMAHDVLNLSGPAARTPLRQEFTITTRTIRRGRRRSVVTAQTSLALQPWRFASVEFADVINVT